MSTNIQEPKFNRVTQLIVYLPKSLVLDKDGLSYQVTYTKFGYTTATGKTVAEVSTTMSIDTFKPSPKHDKGNFKAYITHAYNLLTYYQGMKIHNDNTDDRRGRVSYQIFYTPKGGKRALIKIAQEKWFFQYETTYTERYLFESNLKSPLNSSTISHKKNAVVFFIGGASDKKSFYGAPIGNNIKDVYYLFKREQSTKLVGLDSVIICDDNITYLGYDDVHGFWDIKQNVINKIPNKSDLIYIVGHSLGGWNGAHLTRYLRDDGYQVEMLITLDPVGTGRGVQSIADIYSSEPQVVAKQWINFFCDPNPEDRDSSDFIATLGEQWKPSSGTTYNITTKANHWDTLSIIKTPVASQKNGLDLLIQSIKDNLK